jgi:hypothetical protein
MQLEGRFIRIAHDPGDPQITSHCPFCGSGQVTGRSDGTIDCAFCGMNYIVRVQPAFPGMPQQPMGPGALTDMGPELGPGGQEDLGMGPPGMGMPGEEDEGFPPDDEGGDEGPPPGDDGGAPSGGPEDDGGDSGAPPPPDSKGGGDKDPGSGKKPPKGKKKGSLYRPLADGSEAEAEPDPEDRFGREYPVRSRFIPKGRDDRRPRDPEGTVHRFLDPEEEEASLLQPRNRTPSVELRSEEFIPQLPEGWHHHSGLYRTLAGDALPEDAYVRHLAVLHSGSDPRVLAALRKEAHGVRQHVEMSDDEMRDHMRGEHQRHDLPDDERIRDLHWNEHGDGQRHVHPDIEHEWAQAEHPDFFPGDGFAYSRHEGPIDPVFGKAARSPDAVPRGQHQWLYPVPGSMEWQPSTGGLEHRAHARRCASCGLEARAYPGSQGGLRWRYARSTDYKGGPEREHGDLSQCPGRAA